MDITKSRGSDGKALFSRFVFNLRLTCNLFEYLKRFSLSVLKRVDINVLIFFDSAYNRIKELFRYKERLIFMNLAKISANGQITVPVEIRRLLGLKSGDKVLFLQKPNGEVVINNASAQAIQKAQRAFEGVAEELGVYNEEDVQDLVNEVRYGKGD